MKGDSVEYDPDIHQVNPNIHPSGRLTAKQLAHIESSVSDHPGGTGRVLLNHIKALDEIISRLKGDNNE